MCPPTCLDIAALWESLSDYSEQGCVPRNHPPGHPNINTNRAVEVGGWKPFNDTDIIYIVPAFHKNSNKTLVAVFNLFTTVRVPTRSLHDNSAMLAALKLVACCRFQVFIT